MAMKGYAFAALSLLAFAVVFAAVDLQDGSVHIDDNCKPGDDSTCPDGECCVKEGLAYIPEAPGPKPAYRIACLPYRQLDEFCYNRNTTEICPCAPSLTCTPSSLGGLFGHCK